MTAIMPATLETIAALRTLERSVPAWRDTVPVALQDALRAAGLVERRWVMARMGRRGYWTPSVSALGGRIVRAYRGVRVAR